MNDTSTGILQRQRCVSYQATFSASDLLSVFYLTACSNSLGNRYFIPYGFITSGVCVKTPIFALRILRHSHELPGHLSITVQRVSYISRVTSRMEKSA